MTTEIFIFWIKEIFIPYQESIREKYLLILDKASSHISTEALNDLNIINVLIPSCMTP
mgnify:CR=1 FL=1